MEESQQLQETLKLGKKIVKELKLQDTSDTLSRWMAHYISEKIIQIENENSPIIKDKLQKEVYELILKIWNRRKIQFDNLNPLQELKQSLEVLKSLSKDENEFWSFDRGGFQKDLLVEFASKINSTGFNMLKISLYLSLLPDSIAKATEWNDELETLLSSEEKEIIENLNIYLEDFSKFHNIKYGFEEDDDKETNNKKDYIKKALTKIEELLDKQNNSFKNLMKKMGVDNDI